MSAEPARASSASRDFEPKLLTVLREGYTRSQFYRDALAGVRKREEAQRAAAARARATAAAEQAREQDVVPWLRQLGFRADEARQAAAFCETIPDAPLEERVRVALSYFHPRTARTVDPRISR